MVRVDEHLRMKFVNLCKFNSDVDGWTPETAQINLEHKRMVNSMRCFINMVGVQHYHHQMLSEKEKMLIRNDGLDLQERDFVNEWENRVLYNIANIPSPELNLYLSNVMDKKNTEKLFSKLVQKIYRQNMAPEDEKEIIKAIITNVLFSME